VNASPLAEPILAEEPRDAAACERLVTEAAALLIEPGQVVELRVLGLAYPGDVPRVSISGYFDNPADLARAASRLDGYARGIYFTLNPLRPEILSRASNRMDRNAAAATDSDVIRRRWLPIDLDPIRPPGTNATDDEVRLAVSVAEAVWLAMREKGWSEPLAALSGNGAHLLYPIDLPAADDGLVKRTLQGLSDSFSTDRVRIDLAVSNPSRIWKLPGTIARKGPASPDRPHRRARLLGRPPA